MRLLAQPTDDGDTSLLTQIAKAIGSVRTLEDFVALLQRTLVRELPCDHLSLAIARSTPPTYEVLIVFDREGIREGSLIEGFGRTDGPFATAFTQREPAVYTRACDRPHRRSSATGRIGNDAHESALVLSLRSGGDPIAGLMVSCAKASAFTGEHVALAKEVSGLLACSLASLLLREAVADKQSFLEAVLEHIPNMVFVKEEKNLRFVRFNKAGEELVGVSKSDILGKNDFDLFPPEQARGFTEADRKVLGGNTLVDVPAEKIQTPHGERILHTKKLPIRIGNKTFLLGIAEDITEEARRTEYNAGVVEAAHSAIIMVDSSGVIQLINKRTEELLGYIRSELVGKKIEVLLPRASRTKHAGLVERYLKDPERRAMAARSSLSAKAKDGTEIPVEIALSPVETSDGTCVLAALDDIRDRRAAEELREAQAREIATLANRLTRALDSGRIGVWEAWHSEPARAWWTASFETVLGLKFDSDERSFANFISAVHPVDRCQLAQARDHLIESGGQLCTQVRMRVQGDRYKWFELRVDSDRTGPVLRTVGTVVDIHESKCTADKLLASNRELAQFAYVASHDLQEPLRMVSSFTALLAEEYGDKLDDDAHEYIGYAIDGAKRMQALISDLLELSQLETESIPLDSVQLTSVVKATIESLEASGELYGAEVHVGTLPTVEGDAMQLRTLFQNLIGNGAKFNRSTPPKVRVSATTSLGKVEVAVADNGIGIEPVFLDRIFEVFQRLHERSEFPGTGIGLAIVQKIVEHHSGSIRVDSTPGEGTTFTVTFPTTE